MADVDLLAVLEDAGIDRLREGSKEIYGACPLHEQRTGHPDTHPSWSINKTSFAHFCFSCGYKGTLTGLLTDVTGAAPEDLEITLKQQSLTRKWREARADPVDAIEGVLPRLTEWSLLNVLRQVPRRFMERRRLRPEALDAYMVRYAPETKQVVMPIYTPGGDVLLGAQYRSAGVVLTLPSGLPKASTLFGYAAMAHHDHCALVESPLDAVRLYGLGVPAVASLGAWVSAEQVRLLSLAFPVVYCALDDDKVGREAAGKVTQALRKRGCAVVPWIYQGLRDEDGKRVKDVGDVADDESLLSSWHRTKRMGM